MARTHVGRISASLKLSHRLAILVATFMLCIAIVGGWGFLALNELTEQQAGDALDTRLFATALFVFLCMACGLTHAFLTVRRIPRTAADLCAQVESAASEKVFTKPVSVPGCDEFARIAQSVSVLLQACRGTVATAGRWQL